MQPENARITNAYQIGLLGGLGVLTALVIGGAIATLATVLTYVAAAIFIALGLDPIVRWIETKGLKRPLAILVVLTGVIAVLGGLIWALLPTLIEEATVFIETTPQLLLNITDLSWIAAIDSQVGGAISNAIDGASEFLADSANWPTILGGVVQVGINIFNGFFGGIIILILSIYFMASLTSLKGWIYSLAPASSRERFTSISEQISDAVGRYVIGQVAIASINGIAGFIAMSIIGVPFALVLAFITFLFALIPLVGTISGAILVTLVALFASPTTALAIAIYYLVYMQIEAYLVSPRVMNRAVSVPGAVVVVAALAGGALLGILGALVAIPVAASVILVIRQVFIPRQALR